MRDIIKNNLPVFVSKVSFTTTGSSKIILFCLISFSNIRNQPKNAKCSGSNNN